MNNKIVSYYEIYHFFDIFIHLMKNKKLKGYLSFDNSYFIIKEIKVD